MERLIHIVDDDAAVRDSLRALLESSGMSVRDYDSAHDFLERGATSPDGCVLLDVHMPGMSGLELLDILRSRRFGLPVIVITGRSDSALRVRATEAGACAVFDKPVDEDDLLGAIAATA
jgi:FixJ family two-component response regulator